MPVVFVTKAEKEAKLAKMQATHKIKFKLNKKPFEVKPQPAKTFQQWYEANKEEYNRKRRERYANDPEYKANVRSSAAEWRESHRKPVEKPDVPEGCYTTKQLAAMLNRNAQAVGFWEQRGYIPAAPRDKLGRRIYTAEQVALVREFVQGLHTVEKVGSRASPQYLARVKALVENVASRWKKTTNAVL